MFLINGAQMPSPSALAVHIEERGDASEYNVLGERVVDRLAVKRVIDAAWPMLSAEDMAKLMQAVTDDVFFTVSYPDPGTGALRDAVCRAVERSAGVFRMVDGAARWTDVSMKLEER